MTRTGAERIRSFGLLVISIVFAVIGLCQEAFGQEPPLNPPGVGRLTIGSDTRTFEGWALYPTLKLFSAYSDNWFQSATSPISALGFGVSPSLSAEWTNGIFKTTIYANAEHRDFPAEPSINTFDYQAGITERYELLRDLVFRVEADYYHKTISQGLNSSTPSTSGVPTSSLLQNGNTLLPNGAITTPTGQSAGTSNPGLSVNGTSIVNPYNQIVGTASVDKYFNRGIMSLNATLTHLEYENTSNGLPDYTTPSLSGSASFWLFPTIYIYTQGSVSENSSSQSGNSTTQGTILSNSITGGIGFRSTPMIGGSLYFGHQGSDGDGSSNGGYIFGGSLSYNPTPRLSLSANVSGIINVASGSTNSVSSTLAQALPQTSSLLLSQSSSTQTLSNSISVQYAISQQWKTTANFGYTQVNYIGSSNRTNEWLADATLSYDIWRNMTLTWEYQFNIVDSNIASSSYKRNYAIMTALYRF